MNKVKMSKSQKSSLLIIIDIIIYYIVICEQFFRFRSAKSELVVPRCLAVG